MALTYCKSGIGIVDRTSFKKAMYVSSASVGLTVTGLVLMRIGSSKKLESDPKMSSAFKNVGATFTASGICLSTYAAFVRRFNSEWFMSREPKGEDDKFIYALYDMLVTACDEQ